MQFRSTCIALSVVAAIGLQIHGDSQKIVSKGIEMETVDAKLQNDQQAQRAGCESWCTVNSREWSTKCTWPVCHGCTNCDALPKNCLYWCDRHTHVWSTKCNWEMCDGCANCDAPTSSPTSGTPAPTAGCTVPLNAEDCMKAAEAYGYTWDGKGDWSDRLPGCLQTSPENHANWNNDQAGEYQHDEHIALCTQPFDGACAGLYKGTPPGDREETPDPAEYDKALEALDLESVKADMVKLLTKSQACWPADYGNYGPFFIRLAWHCSGTYRDTDGKGGCGGGRQRFEPERSWADNTNLDKARALLTPIKQKYGIGLSWGDLFVLAGTTAIRSMGAPIKEYCAGRVDDEDGEKSLALGASGGTFEQEKEAPCTGGDGNCQKYPNNTNLATTTLGLIYVNPEGLGPDSKPDPAKSARDIRVTFSKMTGNNDRSTVALIGGGHAFGKTHGGGHDCAHKTEFSEKGAGRSPKEVFEGMGTQIPWLGTCRTGMGTNTFTSGFEGPWTSTPTKWSNEFFRYLVDYQWESYKGPGGHFQWRLQKTPNDKRIRLTSDIALLYDDAYKAIVTEFAENQTALDEAFDFAWTRLTTIGGTWSPKKKCDSMTSMLATDINVHTK